IEVLLQNVSDIPVYNAEVNLLDRPADAPDWQATYSLVRPKTLQVDVIPPGGTFLTHFVVYPALGNNDVTLLQLVPESSFVRRVGGNVGIPTELTVNNVGNCAARSFLPVHTALADKVAGGPDTAVVSWEDPNPPAGVSSYEVLATSALGRPLVST